jgi:hypothetical protein
MISFTISWGGGVSLVVICNVYVLEIWHRNDSINVF